MPPVLPMLAKRASALPTEGSWIFEPKWDGFRVLVFRDGDEVLIQSRDTKPLNRYFPELIEPLREALPDRAVLDGELVVARGGVLDFEALQMRIHPAASRVKLLSTEAPAQIVFFDVLCEGDRDLREVPFAERRRELERLLGTSHPVVHVTPATSEPRTAADWFERFEGAGLDGVMVKSKAGSYEPDKRVMIKVKHERECDCVVAGFRWHKKNPNAVGSLLLGLFDEAGKLQHVGVTASFTNEKRLELVELLAPYRENALANHPWRAWAEVELDAQSAEPQRKPGAKSRWSQGKDLGWEPLRPELVVEVGYDHMQGSRFRHTAQFRRFRADKPPESCTFSQLDVVPPEEIAAIFGQRAH